MSAATAPQILGIYIPIASTFPPVSQHLLLAVTAIWLSSLETDGEGGSTLCPVLGSLTGSFSSCGTIKVFAHY